MNKKYTFIAVIILHNVLGTARILKLSQCIIGI